MNVRRPPRLVRLRLALQVAAPHPVRFLAPALALALFAGLAASGCSSGGSAGSKSGGGGGAGAGGNGTGGRASGGTGQAGGNTAGAAGQTTTGGGGNGGTAGAPGIDPDPPAGGDPSGADAGSATDAGGQNLDAGAPPDPPAATDGLEQRLATRAIGLGYYHLCVIEPSRGIRCSGDLGNAGDPRIHPPQGLRGEQIMGAHNGFCVLRPEETQPFLPELPGPGSAADPDTLAVSVTGKRLTCWGHKNTFFPPANMDMDPIQYGIGYDHGCVLNRDHSVACWGQPGTNATPPPGLRAKQLTVAAFFNCAIKEDDSVVCWGINPPQPPPDLKAKIVAAVFHHNGKLPEAPAGTNHACAIRLDDSVLCWGTEVEGNLTPPPDLTAAKDIAVSTWDSCALRPNGEPVCWGRKVYDNFDPNRYHRMPEGLRLKGIRASMATYCGIKLEDDTVVCWGDEQHDHITFPAGGVKAYAPR